MRGSTPRGPTNSSNAGRFFIQVGAGAGDRDSRSNFRDGFTEFIKKQEISEMDTIVLVEPNPLNIPALKDCWKSYRNAVIYEMGIVTKQEARKSLPFYYTPLDAPHYQVASFNSNHVLKHYTQLQFSDLSVINVLTIDLNTFIQDVVGENFISLLALDIEGLDAEVLLDTNFEIMNVDLISFEHLHLGSRGEDVQKHFDRSGFQLVGQGIDHNGFDLLYKKTITK